MTLQNNNVQEIQPQDLAIHKPIEKYRMLKTYF